MKQELKQCRTCMKEKCLQDYYSRNAHSKAKGDYVYYYPECKECTKDRAMAWQEENYDQYLSNKKRYDKTEKTKLPKYLSNKKRNDNGKYREYMRNNPDKSKKYQEQHRKHDITPDQWIICKDYFSNSDGEYCCAYCGLLQRNHYKRRLEKYFLQDLHKDHVNHDGVNDLSNCIPSCGSCNSSKHKRDMEFWYKSKTYFSEERLLKINKWLNEECIKYIDKLD